MNRIIKPIFIILVILTMILLIVAVAIFLKNKQIDTRADGALRITNCFPKSCQNPVFSPDGKYLLFTRFKNGYNKGPAEIVKINLDSKEEKVIINLAGNNVNVPFGSWMGSKIVFATEGGIATANDDGSNLIEIATPLARNDNDVEQYIEPVFNPKNTNQIVFEAVNGNTHQIKLLEIDKNNTITALTDGDFDDRLPSWSPDNKKILWQRTRVGEDNWQIVMADIIVEQNPHLENIFTLTQGPDDTDNSWIWDGKYILSSRTGEGKIPNIFAFSLKNKSFTRITQSKYENGAATSSLDSKYIAFESHTNKNEQSPTEIWMIKNLVQEYSSVPKEKLKDIKTYANTYIDYTEEDIEKLKKFDIIMVEPYNMKKEWLAELKNSGTIIIAYISVGEADDDRRYWKTWQATENAYDISRIPRTIVDQDDSIFIGPDPGWPGSYFVDASHEQWQKIMLEEEIPYILALGDGLYDGLVMDLIDVVDEYEGKPREQEMRQGMIDLIRQIKEKYPDKIIIPNRGFGVIEEMGPYIDAFKFEELTLKYNNIPGQINYEKYDTQLDNKGNHRNQEQIDQAVEFAKKYDRPIFVLDHVETEPPNSNLAKVGYKEAERLSQKYNARFIWYANSVDQDLPLWNFIE